MSSGAACSPQPLIQSIVNTEQQTNQVKPTITTLQSISFNRYNLSGVSPQTQAKAPRSEILATVRQCLRVK